MFGLGYLYPSQATDQGRRGYNDHPEKEKEPLFDIYLKNSAFSQSNSTAPIYSKKAVNTLSWP